MSKRFDMVICSTLNQLVNYIPIVILRKDIKDIYNITFEKEKNLYNQIDNEKWDNNLKGALSNIIKELNINDIKCESKTMIQEIYVKLKGKNSYKKNFKEIENDIIWNITGGQRDTLLAMLKVIEERTETNNDKIIYFEGNEDELKIINAKDYIGKNSNLEESNLFNKNKDGKNKDNTLHNNNEVTKKELNIEKALQLSGFGIKHDIEMGEDLKCKEFYRELNKTFEKALTGLKDKEFIDLLFNLNKDNKKYLENSDYKIVEEYIERFFKDNKNIKYNILKNGLKKDKKNQIEYNKEYIKVRISENQYEIREFKGIKDKKNLIVDILRWNYKKTIIKKIIGKVSKEQNVEFNKEEIIDDFFRCGGYNKNKFGYIFENMIFTKVLDVIDELENEYFIDVKHSVKVLNEDSTNFAEFDIMLLTKYGKVIVIECKSGTMDHTVAKARAFTAYASNGVYGLPILSIPAIKVDRSKKLYPEVLNTTKNAAERSQMQIWYMDDIKKNLKTIAGEDNVSK